LSRKGVKISDTEPEKTIPSGGGHRKRKSKYIGVFWDNSNYKYAAKTRLAGRTITIGRFHTEEEAARAYDRYIGKLIIRYSRLNFPEDFRDGDPLKKRDIALSGGGVSGKDIDDGKFRSGRKSRQELLEDGSDDDGE
jgi:hypothetical protein